MNCTNSLASDVAAASATGFEIGSARPLIRFCSPVKDDLPDGRVAAEMSDVRCDRFCERYSVNVLRILASNQSNKPGLKVIRN